MAATSRRPEGRGGHCTGTNKCGGGGGAGSQLGNGGHGGDANVVEQQGGSQNGGGGGIVGDGFACGGSPFGNAIGIYEAAGAGPDVCGGMSSNPINAVIRFPFDGFTGCGSNSTVNAGPGGGGAGGGYDTASHYDHAGDGLVVIEW